METAISYSSFEVTARSSAAGKFTDCRVIYAGNFLIVQLADGKQQVIPAHLITRAFGTIAPDEIAF